MSVLPKQKVIDILRNALIQCNGYDVLCSKMSDMISEFEGLTPETKVITIDPVIKHIDNSLRNDKSIKCTKFDKISDALICGHIYPVIISVNDVCYTFESEAMWIKFHVLIEQIYKDDRFSSVVNIYHITPPNAERKARLRYKSVNEKELQLVKKRIAEITKSPIDTIDVSELSKKESCITLTDKIGTHKDVSSIVTDVCYQLLFKHQDDKPRPFSDIQIGDSLCQAEPLRVEKRRNGKFDDIIISPITNYYTVNVNVNGDHSIQQVVGQAGGDANLITTKKKKKKTDEDIAYEWIDSNPYTIKKTRGEYHKKYVRCMNKDNKRHLSIVKFAAIMKDLDYTEGGTSNHKIWEKIDEKDSEGENEKDESSSDDE